MQELIDKVELLKREFDNNEVIKEIKKLNKEIREDRELLSLIEEYRVTRNEEIRRKIISNEKYLQYKHLETEVNFMILKINQELGTINKRSGGCNR